ncbi:hypothetical protein KIK06_29085 [Nocardiopsis sp. EMB25]|uniref:hypothetical protein n=1 Tax=Nocardiopsis sp. EMB25 TaxID=2835867 RepID=UPI00228469AA|nr:hypothetical protein [Nocardiopsis sp. EMB25]MCY9787939.1 hypothetical protein [Nocardiopsis sp. EMB25]
MRPLTVADLRQVLADLPDDTPITDAIGHALVDVDTDDPAGVALLFARPEPRRRTVVNTITGGSHGVVIQTGGDLHGTVRL